MGLVDDVVTLLERRGLRCEIEAVDDGARIDADTDDLPWHVFVGVDEADHRVAMYSLAPLPVAAQARVEVALLLTRVNDGLTIGNFELDLDDGEVRCKTSVDFGDGPVSPAVLGALLDSNLTAMSTYLDAIHSVALGVAAAEDVAAALDDAGL